PHPSLPPFPTRRSSDLDPRRFSLLAFGGAGPLHAAAVARVLGIPKVIEPQYPGVFSALGLLLADIRVDKVWTQAFRSNDVDAQRSEEHTSELQSPYDLV